MRATAASTEAWLWLATIISKPCAFTCCIISPTHLQTPRLPQGCIQTRSACVWRHAASSCLSMAFSLPCCQTALAPLAHECHHGTHTTAKLSWFALHSVSQATSMLQAKPKCIDTMKILGSPQTTEAAALAVTQCSQPLPVFLQSRSQGSIPVVVVVRVLEAVMHRARVPQLCCPLPFKVDVCPPHHLGSQQEAPLLGQLHVCHDTLVGILQVALVVLNTMGVCLLNFC